MGLESRGRRAAPSAILVMARISVPFQGRARFGSDLSTWIQRLKLEKLGLNGYVLDQVTIVGPNYPRVIVEEIQS